MRPSERIEKAKAAELAQITQQSGGHAVSTALLVDAQFAEVGRILDELHRAIEILEEERRD